MAGDFLIFAAIIIFVSLLVFFVEFRRSDKPVEWPQANISVGQTKSFSVTGKPNRKGYYTVIMQMAVETQGGNHFKSVLTRQLPEHKHSLLQQGILIPVMYRPDRLEKVKTARDRHGERAQDFLNQVKIHDGIPDRKILEADLRGHPTYSQMKYIRGTGRKVRGLNEYELGLSVFPAHDEPYSVTKTMMLMNYEAAAMTSGTTLPTRYLLSQPNTLVVSLHPKNGKAGTK